jgi:hypothetical protein
METDASQHQRFERANTLGLAYLRTMILLNGGAILALLTFIGSASAQTFINVSVESIQNAMGLFLIGITTMMVGLIVSYIHEALAPGSRTKEILSNAVITLNGICSLCSLLSFVIGVLVIIYGAQPSS